MGNKKRKRSSGGYRSPGVYIEEVSSGSRPIEGVGTAVAAFVGLVERYPLRAVLTTAAGAAFAVAVVRAVRR
jgi:uncharacterized protein